MKQNCPLYYYSLVIFLSDWRFLNLTLETIPSSKLPPGSSQGKLSVLGRVRGGNGTKDNRDDNDTHTQLFFPCLGKTLLISTF